ncbi:YkgJ family cysteine cluster protein [Candidatus Omnitrophota bacterium]
MDASGLQQFVPTEVCFQCDICCRFTDYQSEWNPSVAEQELYCFIKAGYPPALFDKDNKIKTIPREDIHICPLFDYNKKLCTAYAIRPFDCALYPFVLTRDNKKICLAVDTQCPFVQQKRNTEDFTRFVAYLTKELSSEKWQGIIRNNPQLIGTYKEHINMLQELYQE